MSARSACVNSVAVIIAVLACFGGHVRGDEIAWSADIEASLQKAATSGQPVLLEFTAPWCVYCKRMEKTTFVDPNVVSYINQRFVAVRVDADQNKELVGDLGIKGLPAMLVVSPELKIIERIPGFQTPEALLTKLDRVPLSNVARQNPPASTAQPAEPRKPREELAFEPVELPSKQPIQKIRPVSRPASKPEAPAPAECTTAQAGDAGAEEDFFATISKPASDSQQRPAEDSAGSAKLSNSAVTSAAAFNGTCIVNAVENREIIAGSPQHMLIYKGQQLHFSNEESKQKFESQPSAYWPMLDGVCPITLLDEEQEVQGDLQFAAFFRKRLWVFTTEQHLRQFLEEPAEIMEEVEEMMADRAGK